MSTVETDYIPPETALTLDGMFRERCRRSGTAPAYMARSAAKWETYSWEAIAAKVARWQRALLAEGLRPGDRVAVMVKNSLPWILLDQAALGLGLVVVPLFIEDRPDNIGYILDNAGVRLLLVQDGRAWRRLAPTLAGLPELSRVLLVGDTESDDERVRHIETWLPPAGVEPVPPSDHGPDDLATIIYTSGTTGYPKGVMLSHRNILTDVAACLTLERFLPTDLFLSFLPLSHAFERTGGYYLPMMSGACVAFARSVQLLPQDLREVRPTILLAVPRVFERIYSKLEEGMTQRRAPVRGLFRLTVMLGWRAFRRRQAGRGGPPASVRRLQEVVSRPLRERFGGRIRFLISGGAALPLPVARLFLGLGFDLLQGYGLTEAAPVVAVNPPADNDPASVGPPLPGLEVRIGEHDELLVRGPNVMQGYWNRPTATAATIDPDGWLHTGDQARLENGHIHLTGRLKDVLVLSNGEKVPPGDMECCITLDPLFSQAVLFGEGHAYLAALLDLDPEHWAEVAAAHGLDAGDPASLTDKTLLRELLRRVNDYLRGFPGYAKIRRIALTTDEWNIDNGLLTPTLKVRRSAVADHYSDTVAALFSDGPH